MNDYNNNSTRKQVKKKQFKHAVRIDSSLQGDGLQTSSGYNGRSMGEAQAGGGSYPVTTIRTIHSVY